MGSSGRGGEVVLRFRWTIGSLCLCLFVGREWGSGREGRLWEFFEEFKGGGIGGGIGTAAFGSSFGDAGGFGGVEFGELVVEFDPVGEGNVTKAHCDVVVGAVSEGTVGKRFRCC